MSMGEDQPVFASFLRKRKKRMKLQWVTYWFRLQNATLCFYSQKQGSPLQLKGQYYIRMVQSVREVQKSEGKRYIFEISMKNGKRKLLAADTADLRQTWVSLLWEAMQSPAHEHPDPACIWQEGAELRMNGRGRTRSSGSEGERRGPESGYLRPASELWNGTTLTPELRRPDTPPDTPPNPPSLVPASFDRGLWRSSVGPQEEEEEDAEEDHYDTLPCRTAERVLQEVEHIYDIPLCNMRATEDTHTGDGEMEESIYDVPSSLLRRLSGQSIGGGQSGEAWPSDSMGVPEGGDARFRSASVGWMAPSAEG